MNLTFLQQLKLKIFSRGIDISPAAERLLTNSGNRKLVIRDYATTSGLTLIIEDEVYVNCPIGEWFCDNPAAILMVSSNGRFELHADGQSLNVNPLPLPSYIDRPEMIATGVMTHSDRVRLSPISGCSCSCIFCDWNVNKYNLHDPLEQLRAFSIACMDSRLPPRHVLVSGGTPYPKDENWFEQFCVEITAASPLPVDIMLMPRSDPQTIDRLIQAGVHGFAINLEIFDPEIASNHCKEKSRVGRTAYAETIARAVALTGGNGRVRSLLLVGAESAETTLKGVEFIAALGADPVLSPFRPAQGTILASVRPPTYELMADVYLAATSIVERYGVKLGPRCIPCMHNTITFPDGSSAYYYS
ncbi:MAG: hypothetical protein AB2L22_12915 [Syntrophales bacterium]